MISCRDGRCTVEGPVTMGNVTATLAEGNTLFGAPHTVVDLGGVTEVDSSAVSLLLEWRRTARAASRTIEFVNLPANLKSLADLYGVAALLDEG
jgi:phospholipid transport system transporter-binding protein